MKARWLRSLIVWAVLATTFLNAAIVPGRWEKVEALEEGYPITVKLASGERIKAAYVGFTDEALVLKRDSGRELVVPKAAVLTVTSQERNSNDGLRNGAIIGAAAGGGFALAVGLHLADGDDYRVVAAYSALYAAIGMGVGVGVDVIIKGHEVLYQSQNQ
jgi:hypothetical protein